MPDQTFAMRPPASSRDRSSVGEIARVFLKLGATAFGGPAAHVAMMHQELVVRRGWLTSQAFLDLVGATNLIPGPNSTEMAIHLGYRRGGWPGLLVAGLSFIVPAALMVWALAAAYVRVGMLPDVRAVFHGVAPVIVVVVAIALWTLATKSIRSSRPAVIAIVAIALLAAGVNELLLLALGAVAGVLTSRPSGRFSHSGAMVVVTAGPLSPAAADTAGYVAASVPGLFWVFLKAGALLFGSGYVLFAFLRADLVARFGWLTESQLVDAIAIGQMTPGPLFTTATFIGYLLGGSRGALVATVAIFFPAFVYVALSGWLVPRLRQSPSAGGALDGVNAVSLAMMAAVSWQLGRTALVDGQSYVVAAAALLVLVFWKANPVWPILAGAIAGWIGGRVA